MKKTSNFRNTGTKTSELLHQRQKTTWAQDHKREEYVPIKEHINEVKASIN